MSIFTQIPFLLSESARGWWRHRTSTWPVLLTVFFSTFLLLASATALLALYWSKAEASPLAEARIWISDAAPAEATEQLRVALLADPAVLSVRRVDRKQALHELRAWEEGAAFTDRDSILLPSSWAATLREPWRNADSLEQWQKRWAQNPHVDEVVTAKALAKGIQANADKILAIALAVSVVVAVVLWTILGNAVRLSLYGRRALVENMQVLGATTLFIMTPFALECLAQVWVASVAAVVLTGLVSQALLHFLGLGVVTWQLALAWICVVFGNGALALFVTLKTLRGFLQTREEF